MGMLIIGLAAFIIIGGIEVTIVGLMGLSLIGLFVALSMAVSKIVFHIISLFNVTCFKTYHTNK